MNQRHLFRSLVIALPLLLVLVVPPAQSVLAADNTGTGGTITYTDANGLNLRSSPPYNGGYVFHTFTSSGRLNIPVAVSNADVLVVAAGSVQAEDWTALTGDGTAQSYSYYGGEYDGFRFVTGPKVPAVNWLGYYDAPLCDGSGNPVGTTGDGLASSHVVQLWRVSDWVKIAETTIAAGTNEMRIGSFRGHAITEIILSPNTTYALVASGAGGDRMREGSDLSGWSYPNITMNGGCYAYGGPPTFGWGIMISANLMGYVPLQVAVTAPTNGQTVLPSVTATAMVAGGTPPYTVTLYTNSAVAWSTNNASTNLFSIYLGTLAVGTYTTYAKVTDSAAPAATYTSATNTFTVVAVDPILTAVGALTNHIKGVTILNATQIATHSQTLINESPRFADSTNIIQAVFDLVRTYDTTPGYGPLWINVGDLPRSSQTNLDLTWTIYRAMQDTVDKIYTRTPLSKYPSVFNGFKFECSSKFPGACAAPAATNQYTVAVNASHPHTFGRITMNAGGFARRPTGAYAAPGTVVTVTVPPALVGQGYKIRVGCHSWDHGEMQKDPMKRLDRVSTLYDIVSTDTLVANPLGGNLYIEVPYLASHGVVNVTFTAAARSPLCQVTSFHTTTPSEWLTERTQPGPWADFETDKYMMQVPLSWIYALADPFTILANWDTGVDVANDLMGFPRIPGKPTLYQQIDIDMRGNALFPGYPFNNATYDPNYDYGGNYTNHFMLSGPQNEFWYIWHETGHSYLFPKFGGETESTIDLLNVAVHNRGFGMPLEQAFTSAYYSPNQTTTNCAVYWMTTLDFSPRQVDMGYKAYQPWGLAKFIDVVKLFGWSGLDAYYYYYNSNDEYQVAYPTDNDSLLLQLCKSLGKDVRPLILFWGITPQNPTNLAAQVAAAGLTAPLEIRDLLYAYKALVPTNNAAFRAFCTSWYGSQPSTHGYGFEQQHARQWDNIVDVPSNQQVRFPTEIFDETAAATVKARVQGIIDLYYPPPATPPTLSGYGPLTGASFPLTFSGPSGQTYQVLRSTNVALPMASWTVLSSGTFGASPVTYTDTSATNAQQFYRIKSP